MRQRTSSQKEIDRYKRKSKEMRQMIREAAEGMAAAGMDKVKPIPTEHIERRRLWANCSDRRSITGRLMGDPLPERSALQSRQA